jgi:hypothetical protein
VGTVALSVDRETIQDISLREDSVARNLVRNASFESTWLDAQNPDGWYPVHIGGRASLGERLAAGQRMSAL